jgi:hypothetical protein
MSHANVAQSSLYMFVYVQMSFANVAVSVPVSSIICPVQLCSYCNENTIYLFLFWEFRGLSTNIRIHVSVSDLYIPRIGLHIFLLQNRQTDPGNI